MADHGDMVGLFLLPDAKLQNEGEVKMNPAQIARLASNLSSLGAFLDDGFTGTMGRSDGRWHS